MARTRRGYRSRFKRRRVSRRRVVHKRPRRSWTGKRRFGRRKFTTRRRRIGRYSRRKGSRGGVNKVPISNSNVKFLTLKTDIRPIVVNGYQATATGDPPSIGETAFYPFTNTIGLFGSSALDLLIEKPDVFPPHGHNGLFVVLSLDTYIRAMCGSFFGFRNTRKLNTIDVKAYGIKGVMSESELALRKELLEHARCNLYKIGIRFKRRVGRSTNNHSVHVGSVTEPLYYNAAQTSANVNGSITGSLVPNSAIVTHPNASDVSYIPNTSGDLPFYSQDVDYFMSPWQLYERLRAGFPPTTTDGITGKTFSAGIARYCRLANEMSSGREWKEHSGSKSLHFSIGKKKHTGDFLRVNYTASGSMNRLSIGDANTTVSTNTDYQVAGSIKNFPSGSNSFECFCAVVQEAAVLGGGDVTNVCTLPALDGPRGTTVIWVPYSLSVLNAMYDIEIYGKYRFSNKTMSSLDIPLYMADTDIIMM